MSKSLEEVLGYVSLTGVVQKIKTGIPDFLPPQFFSMAPKKVVGTSGRYVQVKGTRRVARLTHYGAGARKRELKAIEQKDVKLLHAFEYIQMDPLVLQWLRAYEEYVVNMGIEEVDRQSKEFKAYFDNLDLSMVYSMLANGAIYFNDDGNLLPSSSGAEITIEFNIPAANKNQLNGIISASWANANTDIPLQLRNLKSQALKDSGYELKYCFYGKNVPTYLTQNNYVLDYLARNPTLAAPFLERNEIPNGLFGFQWWPVYSSFFEDASGTNQEFFGADAVVFAPEINSDVFDRMEGSYQVPSTFNVTANIMAALNTMKTVHGDFGYGKPSDNPLGIQLFYGTTKLSVWKVEPALYIGDCVP